VAKLRVELRDTIWDTFYQPVIRLVEAATERLNRLQFLTIRSYLTLVFAALVLLLIVVGAWR
jgi:cation transport ATPase